MLHKVLVAGVMAKQKHCSDLESCDTKLNISSLDHGNKFIMRNLYSLWYIPNQDQFLEDLGVGVLGCAVLLNIFIGFANWNQLILFPVY